jgi:hypothetical protein
MFQIAYKRDYSRKLQLPETARMLEHLVSRLLQQPTKINGPCQFCPFYLFYTVNILHNITLGRTGPFIMGLRLT